MEPPDDPVEPPDDPVEESPASLASVPASPVGLAGRLDPGMPGARALAVVAALAALLAGGYLWLSRPRPQPVTGAAAVPSLAAPARPMSSAPTAGVVVHVAGKVRHPGVVTLVAGARVRDAVMAAGGLRPGATIGSLNLARKVIDGEQILVGTRAGPGSPVPAGTVPGAASGMPLDLNAATLEQFQELPGVGPVLAQRIVDYRTRNGGFHSVEQLREVTGIGARRFDDLKDLVRV
jgi:competence protein ComEA